MISIGSLYVLWLCVRNGERKRRKGVRSKEDGRDDREKQIRDPAVW